MSIYLRLRSDDEPLGYLLYGVVAALRPNVTAALRPLGLGLPQFVCLPNPSTRSGQSGAALARRVHASPHAMNPVLRALEGMRATEVAA